MGLVCLICTHTKRVQSFFLFNVQNMQTHTNTRAHTQIHTHTRSAGRGGVRELGRWSREQQGEQGRAACSCRCVLVCMSVRAYVCMCVEAEMLQVFLMNLFVQGSACWPIPIAFALCSCSLHHGIYNTHGQAHTHTHTHTGIHTYTRAGTHTYIRTQAYTHTHSSIHPYKHTHTRAHTYTHTHTHIQQPRQQGSSQRTLASATPRTSCARWHSNA